MEKVNEKTFPLHTNKSLAERWGVSKQLINNWRNGHEDFCEPIEGLIEGSGTYYPLYEVERYEEERGGRENVANHNKKKVGRPSKQQEG